jgi:hypothetical protein
MREDQVYVFTKKWFTERGLRCVAGQPPRGCDNVPVVEIKDIGNFGKGSFGAFKPDLVFLSPRVIVICECKPAFSESDVAKLNMVDDSPERKKMFFVELNSRAIFARAGVASDFLDCSSFARKLRYCVSYSGIGARQAKVASLEIAQKTGTLHEASHPNYRIF